MIGKKQPHFPTAYAAIETKQLIEVYAAGPKRIRQAIESLTEEDRSSHPRPGKWSIKEIIFHLTDSEIIGASRIRQTYAQSDMTYASYDQDVWSLAFRYQTLDQRALEESVQLFELLRATAARIFQNAADENWKRSGLHGEWGDITLRQLLELYADHGERHIEQILQLREMFGKPLMFPLLLKTRLY